MVDFLIDDETKKALDYGDSVINAFNYETPSFTSQSPSIDYSSNAEVSPFVPFGSKPAPAFDFKIPSAVDNTEASYIRSGSNYMDFKDSPQGLEERRLAGARETDFTTDESPEEGRKSRSVDLLEMTHAAKEQRGIKQILEEIQKERGNSIDPSQGAAMAILATLPALAGAAFGGKTGAAIGLQAGMGGVGTYGKIIDQQRAANVSSLVEELGIAKEDRKDLRNFEQQKEIIGMQDALADKRMQAQNELLLQRQKEMFGFKQDARPDEAMVGRLKISQFKPEDRPKVIMLQDRGYSDDKIIELFANRGVSSGSAGSPVGEGSGKPEKDLQGALLKMAPQRDIADKFTRDLLRLDPNADIDAYLKDPKTPWPSSGAGRTIREMKDSQAWGGATLGSIQQGFGGNTQYEGIRRVQDLMGIQLLKDSGLAPITQIEAARVNSLAYPNPMNLDKEGFRLARNATSAVLDEVRANIEQFKAGQIDQPTLKTTLEGLLGAKLQEVPGAAAPSGRRDSVDSALAQNAPKLDFRDQDGNPIQLSQEEIAGARPPFAGDFKDPEERKQVILARGKPRRDQYGTMEEFKAAAQEYISVGGTR